MLLVAVIGLYILGRLRAQDRWTDQKTHTTVVAPTPEVRRAQIRATRSEECGTLLAQERARLLTGYSGSDHALADVLLQADDHVIDSLAGIWDLRGAMARVQAERARAHANDMQRKRHLELERLRSHAEQERHRAYEAEQQYCAEQRRAAAEIAAASRDALRNGLLRIVDADVADDALRFFTKEDIERYTRGGVLRDMVILKRRQQ